MFVESRERQVGMADNHLWADCLDMWDPYHLTALHASKAD
jgi:hypothetical protein